MQIVLLLWCLLFSTIVKAADPGLGGIAENLEVPVNVVMQFIGTASIIAGMTCLFGAFIKYMQHRVNPLVAPISTIILLFFIGLALLGLPFMYKLTGYGVPFHFF